MRRVLLAAFLVSCAGAQPTPVESAPVDTAKSQDPAAYAAVAEVFNKKRPNISGCFAAAVEKKELKEESRGRVKIALTVLPSGLPQNVHVDNSTLNSPTVETCVVGMIEKWSLPAPSQPLDFVFTYEFSNR